MEWLNADALPYVSSGACTINVEAFSKLCLEMRQNESNYQSRIESAKLIKNICLIESNREMILMSLTSEFSKVLNTMLQDESRDIIRYALFILYLFGDKISSFSGM